MSSGRTLAQATAELKYDIKRGYFRVLTEDEEAILQPELEAAERWIRRRTGGFSN